MDQVGNLLLPLFFVVTGLSLNIGAMGGDAFILLAVLVVVACAGKLAPGYWVPRASGLTPRDSATIASLVNTRGLTELIALNVGLVDGIINPRLFTVLVLMALITTLATGPLLSVIRPVRQQQLTAVNEYVLSKRSDLIPIKRQGERFPRSIAPPSLKFGLSRISRSHRHIETQEYRDRFRPQRR
jgi:Kef-type K+ transport system membrane component KefB